MGKTFDFTQHGWDNVAGANPGEFSSLTPGAYLCSVVKAEATESKAGREMLVLYLDIADGQFAGYFRNLFRKFGGNKGAAPKWSNNATYRQVIFDNNKNITSFCKGLLETFANADSTFKIIPTNFDVDSLVGKRCPFLFAAEEYEFNGATKTRTAVTKPINIDDFKTGNFTVPPAKKSDNLSYAAPHNNSNDPLQGTPVANEDLPF